MNKSSLAEAWNGGWKASAITQGRGNKSFNTEETKSGLIKDRNEWM